MRLFKRTSWTAKPAPAPPTAETSLRSRITFFRALFVADQQRSPSVDQVQQQHAAEQRRRADAGTDTIAKSIAEQGVWMPHDGPWRRPWN